nr:transglutaminase domain-containing protein [Nocardioidaceae bacterium]
EYGYGYEAMVKFLEERRGFCQQFAATMAMMARVVGIPSRIVVGFLKPERLDSDSDSVFTTDNYHSWPELYFEGVGWVRFEPTPGVGASLPTYAPRPGSDSEKDPRSTEPTESAPDTFGPTLEPEFSGAPTTTDAAPADAGSGGSPPSRRWLVVLAAGVLLALPGLVRQGVRSRRRNHPGDPVAAAEAAWLELRDSMVDLRLPWTGSMTPRARERDVSKFLRGDRESLSALNRLTLSVEQARYANSLSPDSHPGDDVKVVVTSLARSSDKGHRLGALMLPASLLSDLRAELTRRRESWATRRVRSAV